MYVVDVFNRELQRQLLCTFSIDLKTHLFVRRWICFWSNSLVKRATCGHISQNVCPPLVKLPGRRPIGCELATRTVSTTANISLTITCASLCFFRAWVLVTICDNSQLTKISATGAAEQCGRKINPRKTTKSVFESN